MRTVPVHYLIIVAIVATVFLLIAFGSRLVLAKTACSELARQLYPHLLHCIQDSLEDDRVDLWSATGGAGGIYKRWRNRLYLTRLCQIQCMEAKANEAELRYALERAATITSSSLAALLWHLIRFVAPERAGRSLRRAVVIYSELAMHTHSLIEAGDAPLCARMLAEIL